MKTYVVVRRNGWSSADELRSVLERSLVESERTFDEIGWIRSYVLDERDGSVGTLCVFTARSPEAVRRNAAAAGLRVDEIVEVADTGVVHADPVSTGDEVSAATERLSGKDRWFARPNMGMSADVASRRRS